MPVTHLRWRGQTGMMARQRPICEGLHTDRAAVRVCKKRTCDGADGQGRDERGCIGRGQDRLVVGLVQAPAQLGKQLVARDARGGAVLCLGRDRSASLPRDLAADLEQQLPGHAGARVAGGPVMHTGCARARAAPSSGAVRLPSLQRQPVASSKSRASPLHWPRRIAARQQRDSVSAQHSAMLTLLSRTLLQS